MFPTSQPAAAPPPDPTAQPAGDMGGGDGFHHYTLDQDDMGYHAVHTGPDGVQTPSDPSSPEEAAQNMQQCMGGGDQSADSAPAPDGDSDDMSSAPDFSAHYSK